MEEEINYLDDMIQQLSYEISALEQNMEEIRRLFQTITHSRLLESEATHHMLSAEEKYKQSACKLQMEMHCCAGHLSTIRDTLSVLFPPKPQLEL